MSSEHQQFSQSADLSTVMTEVRARVRVKGFRAKDLDLWFIGLG